jgi:hypothetical protein
VSLSSLPLHIGGHVEVFFEHEGKQHLVHTSRRCPVCLEPLTGLLTARVSGSEVHARCDKKLPAYQSHIQEVPY